MVEYRLGDERNEEGHRHDGYKGKPDHQSVTGAIGVGCSRAVHTVLLRRTLNVSVQVAEPFRSRAVGRSVVDLAVVQRALEYAHSADDDKHAQDYCYERDGEGVVEQRAYAAPISLFLAALCQRYGVIFLHVLSCVLISR